jgi:hypothetical protein
MSTEQIPEAHFRRLERMYAQAGINEYYLYSGTNAGSIETGSAPTAGRLAVGVDRDCGPGGISGPASRCASR